jgi:hypothetical protein
LNHPVSAVLLEMGLGKSVISLTAINDLMLDYLDVSRTLVITPLRVASATWPDEIKKWDHLKHLNYCNERYFYTGSRRNIKKSKYDKWKRWAKA